MIISSNTIFENSNCTPPISQLSTTNNISSIDRPNQLGFNEISDVACIDRFISSDEFYGGLLDAYSDIILGGSGDGDTEAENLNHDSEQNIMDNYIGNTLLGNYC